MGADSRRAPPLPAPTETDTGSELHNDVVSRVTDRSSATVPDDGSPVTLSTRKKRLERGTDDLAREGHTSATSLLIEYFDGKGGSPDARRPSVRVKVTPSSKSRSRSAANERVEITESKGTRRPSHTKRISLSGKGDKVVEVEGDTKSVSSYASQTEESNVSRNPIEIEVMPRSRSPLIPSTVGGSTHVYQLGSDVSSMPADSFLDGKSRSTEETRSRSLTRGEALAAGAAAGLGAAAVAATIHTPSRRRSRSLSRERIAEKEKSAEKVRSSEKSEHRRRKHSDQSRSRSVSNSEKAVSSPRRRSSRGHADESLLTVGEHSQLSGSGVSGGQRSFRSGTSKSSGINNPKLLETVEDAIRRLILPELKAIKQENNRQKFERDHRSSFASGSTGTSRDSRDEVRVTRKVSTRSSAPDIKPKIRIDDREVTVGESSRRTRREDRDSSPRYDRRSATEEREITRPRSRKSDENKTLLGTIGAALGLTAAAAATHHQRSKDSLDETKERRRERRAKSRSQSESLESHEGRKRHEVVPPMPLMSDINASEVTRTSILSADTERPHSASGERLVTPLRDVRLSHSPGSRTPTRSPMSPLRTVTNERDQRELSQESLQEHELQQEEEYELNEYGQKVPMRDSYGDNDEAHFQHDPHRDTRIAESAAAGAAAGMLGAQALHHHDRDGDVVMQDYDDDDGHVYHDQHGEVPPPLRYVPYNATKRGLSPIPSVSGYTENEGVSYHQAARSKGSYSSTLEQSPQHQRSATSGNSESPVRHNRHDFAEVRHGGLADSELTQEGEGEYWDEQHRENDRAREFDAESYRSGDTGDYKRRTGYTDDSFDGPERVSAGQSVRGVGANPGYVHTPMGVESAVASLVSASVLTAGSGGEGGMERKASYASYEEGSEGGFMARGESPRKDGRDRDMHSESSSPTKYPEYELDEHGRKVTMPQYKTTHDTAGAALAGAAVGAAAAAAVASHRDDRQQTGVPLHKSFRDRAMDLGPREPRHSLDRLSQHDEFDEKPTFGISGVPDASDPMPDFAFVPEEDMSDAGTNQSYQQDKSIIRKPLPDHGNLSDRRTPTRLDTAVGSRSQDVTPGVKEAGAALMSAAAAAGAAAAIASHEREMEHDHDDNWKRTSDEAKRDTLVTNPYEGTSPVTLLGGAKDRNMLQEMGYDAGHPGPVYATGSPGGLPKDEGYISSAPVGARSPGAITPQPRKGKGVDFSTDVAMGTGALAGDDPFYQPKHGRHLSGLSAGMESPIYDSATGQGIDRIKSQDIVALMDHLTVRDAQRNARDTEILVTLVRAAAEMRNSFDDMKRLLADTEDVIITEVQRNTEKSVQKVINGPRPLPASASRSLRGSQPESMVTDDIPNKKRNVFRRALKGLSMKSSNDLAKIEAMLVQLLGEVEGLKAAQALGRGSTNSDPYDDMQQEGAYEQDHGYEPEGTAGTTTASHASQSGHFSAPLSRGATGSRGFDGRKFSDHRISTVPEGNEDELDEEEQRILGDEYDDQLLTPTRSREEAARGASVPLSSPPQQQGAQLSHSNENTPSKDKSKKHKSMGSGGWNPMKKISRWSETTASTVAEKARNFRNSGTTRDSGQFDHPVSRSGSDLGQYDDSQLQHGDKLHSEFSAENVGRDDYYDEDGHQQMASLLPPEDPKYKAHRNSLNLQHPQPRPGPTQRYQTALETQAYGYTHGAPLSPRSEDWGSSTSVNRLPPNANRYSRDTQGTGELSPTSDGGYAAQEQPSLGLGLQATPARPPKEPLNFIPTKEPLNFNPPVSASGPEIPPKVRLTKPSPLSNEHLNAESLAQRDAQQDGKRMSDASSQGYESPSMATRTLSNRTNSLGLGVPTRKPTGPRSMGSPRARGENEQTPRERKRDTFGTIASAGSVESETF